MCGFCQSLSHILNTLEQMCLVPQLQRLFHLLISAPTSVLLNFMLTQSHLGWLVDFRACCCICFLKSWGSASSPPLSYAPYIFTLLPWDQPALHPPTPPSPKNPTGSNFQSQALLSEGTQTNIATWNFTVCLYESNEIMKLFTVFSFRVFPSFSLALSKFI